MFPDSIERLFNLVDQNRTLIGFTSAVDQDIAALLDQIELETAAQANKLEAMLVALQDKLKTSRHEHSPLLQFINDANAAEKMRTVLDNRFAKQLIELNKRKKLAKHRDMLFAILFYQLNWDEDAIMSFWNIQLDFKMRILFGNSEKVKKTSVHQGAVSRGPKLWKNLDIDIKVLPKS